MRYINLHFTYLITHSLYFTLLNDINIGMLWQLCISSVRKWTATEFLCYVTQYLQSSFRLSSFIVTTLRLSSCLSLYMVAYVVLVVQWFGVGLVIERSVRLPARALSS